VTDGVFTDLLTVERIGAISGSSGEEDIARSGIQNSLSNNKSGVKIGMKHCKYPEIGFGLNFLAACGPTLF